jgi:(p)ppGpp synthase/HD superfamily hydrolase
MSWLNAIREWQEEFVGNRNCREFVETITRDLLGGCVFVETITDKKSTKKSNCDRPCLYETH